MSAVVRDERGSLALLTLLLLPALLVVLVGVLELGLVRLVAERARIAADLATLVAINDHDPRELARSGLLRPAADAETVARRYFALNLEAISAELAASPDVVASTADVVVFADTPVLDARTGRRYDRPTVRLLADVPIRTPAFAVIARPITTISILSASSAR